MGEGETAQKILEIVTSLKGEVALINHKLGDVDEHERALKGSNGNIGMIAQVTAMSGDVKDVKATIEVLRRKGCLLDDVKPSRVSDNEKFIDWKTIREKFTIPVVVALLMFLLFEVGPNLISKLP